MRVEEAIKRESIREGILRSLRNLSSAVERNVQEHPYLLDYAREVREARLGVAENYSQWMSRARDVLESRGVEVHFARNARRAREIAGEIVGSGKVVVKAKSMVSEEIHLREHLERLGNEVWETDLGELIVQLANEKPMHMVIPALHYSEGEVAEILKKIGVTGKSAEELAEGVRRFMREKFLKADVGISGCNAFSAESGRIFLIENEGNIRLSTTLPKTYIALVSIDKILPNDELCLKSVFVQSAFFGTFPPAYINVNERIEGQEMHVILIDNGRSEARFREQLSCVKCGRCQLECPVFQLAGNIWGGDVYGGPMGMVWSAITAQIPENVFLSTLCGKCMEVCPMEIDMPSMLREMKRSIVQGEDKL
ncbi:iron-sulfur cluster-binding protein [Geoglobus ahangari]|uniref:Iron-sulfur cluster-binding protein n=1 Tax=Geoglobus ahangari TaxID=113653 RepID=A0A0F7DCA5_9EURY|nr:LutB/LldF family L-lactate oxidation iron-sulfur protein [Geoglobus ahangari]AKG92501.1 iron-sulfur cluster-binding protein [Geoglobus ahangari]